MDKYLDGYHKFIEKYNMVGSNLLFLRNDGYLENVTSGYSNLETKEVTTTLSVYKIASVSKVIVAVGLLKLYEQNKLSLDQDISEYLGFKVQNPFYPDDIITLRMILTQTSSIIDNGRFEDGIYKGYYGANQTDDFIKLEDILTPTSMHYYHTFSNHKPGTNFSYSNLGCGIIACICEKITKKHFRDYIKEVLLEPLNIKSGFRVSDVENEEDIVCHYTYENDEFHLYGNHQTFKQTECLEYPLGDNYRGVAGGLYISAQDLSKIMGMLMNKGIYNNQRILEEKTVSEMETVWWEGIPEDPTYRKKGLQMIIMDQFSKKPLMGHFGNAYGLRSFMLYNELGGLIFLCNGANFLTDEDHMTKLQEELIKYLVEITKISL